MDSWQVRAELEWPDAITAVPPSGWRWSDVCFWIVNSNGVANDPQRRLVKFGGQLHTPVLRDSCELYTQSAPLFERLSPVPNYRSSMRVGVRVPQLQTDLAALKQLADYTRRHLPRLWSRVDPVHGMLDVGVHDHDANKGAHRRLIATLRARHFLMPEADHRLRMTARTVPDFCSVETLAVPAGRGPRAWSPAMHESVDLRQVSDNGWVTFRCFAQACSARQLQTAARFAVGWIAAALDDVDPGETVRECEDGLPRQKPYVHAMEQGWLATNFHHHPRRVVAVRLAQRGIVTS